MNTLKDIVENFTEVPSERCWNSIADQLSAMMPTNSSSCSNPSTHTVQTISEKVATIATKTAAISGKMIFICSTAIVATTIAIFTIIHYSTPSSNTPAIEPIENPISNNDLVPIVNNDTIFTEIVEPKEEKTPTNFSENETPIQNTKTEKKTEKLDEPASKSENVPQPTSPTQPHNNSTPTPTSNVQAQSNMPSNAQTSNTETKPTSTPSQIPQSHFISTDDPILENIELPETPIVKIEIPNIFTPNNDGFNDTFEIRGIESCEETRLTIRNKYGKIIYDVMNYNNEWTGNDFPEGVYTFTFTYKIHNINDRISGKVMIKR